MTNTSDANDKLTKQKEDVNYVVEPGWGRGYISGFLQLVLAGSTLSHGVGLGNDILNPPKGFTPKQPDPVVVKPEDSTQAAIQKNIQNAGNGMVYALEKQFGDVKRTADLVDNGVQVFGSILGVGALEAYRTNNGYKRNKKSPKPSNKP